MAPLPPESTARYFVDYSVGGVEHTFQVRFDGVTSPSAFGDTLNALLNTIDTQLYQITINQVRFAADGSNVSNPVVSGIEGNTYGTGAPADNERADFLNFVGRTTGGRRVTMAIYGLNAVDDGFRSNAAEDPDVEAAVDILNGEEGLFLGIDGLNPVWKPYVNNAASGYWQRKLRS